MQTTILVALSLALAAQVINSKSILDSSPSRMVLKKFNYQGTLTIKDDRTAEIIKHDEGDDDTVPMIETSSSSNQTIDEAACWKLIVDESAVTFSLQNRVLDELAAEMENLIMEPALKKSVLSITTSLRSSMRSASEALENGSAEEFFDSLFDTSEGIVHFSSLIRDPKLDEKVFLVLVKAVSRLGRNNSALIQEFVDNCTVINRSRPQPREFY